MRIRVYQSEDLIEELDGSYLRDCYNREVRINSWADAMNYIETDAYRKCTGVVYYDTAEDAYESYCDGFCGNKPDMSFEEFEKNLDKWTIGDMCGGYIEEIDDEEEEEVEND